MSGARVCSFILYLFLRVEDADEEMEPEPREMDAESVG